MLRIAIPYGVLSPRQLRQLAMIGRTWDRGYGHFTTRQNLQFNWVKLVDIPDVLAALADVEMHCIQTSGNCVRNVTADPFAGAANDELEDPRPWCEILRQWSTLHPEFSWLPRKFKIAVSGAAEDRAAIAFHDIGLKIVRGPDGRERLPRAGRRRHGPHALCRPGDPRLPAESSTCSPTSSRSCACTICMAAATTFNKARIKILVNQLGIDKFREDVEADWEATRKDAIDLPADGICPHHVLFRAARASRLVRSGTRALDQRRNTDPAFANWLKHNVRPHRVPGYVSVVISLKEPGRTPGDASSDQMEFVADLAERYSLDEVRVNYTQNLILPHVARSDLVALYDELKASGLATGNYDLLGRHDLLPGPRLLQSRQCPLDPDRQGDRQALRRSEAPGVDRPAPAQHVGLHQRLRPSSFRQYRHSRRRQERHRALPDLARRQPEGRRRGRHHHRPRLPRRGRA